MKKLEALKIAVGRMALLRHFPSTPEAQAALMHFLDRFVSTPEQASWLSDSVCDNYTEWPGPRELRAIFCTRYVPTDGIRASLSPTSAYAPPQEPKDEYGYDEEDYRRMQKHGMKLGRLAETKQ